MVDELCAGLPIVAEVTARVVRGATRPVLLRSPAGGGADLVASAAAAQLRDLGREVDVVDLDPVDDAGLLVLRARRRTRALILASSDDVIPARLARLFEYLRPDVLDVGPLSLDETRELIDRVLGAGACDDRLAAEVLRATAGRAGDVVAVARHLPTGGRRSPLDLCALASVDDRIAASGTAETALPWAVALAEGVPTLAERLRPHPSLRPVDAAVLRDRLAPGERLAVLRELCDAAAAASAGAPAAAATPGVPTGSLSQEEQVVVATWWCDLADAADGVAALGGPELQALLPGVFGAAELGRWHAAGRIAERLWRTTHVPQAALGVAAALARSEPTTLLDEVLVAHPDDEVLVATAAFSRALWQLYLEHRPDLGRATLEQALARCVAHADICEDGLATIDLHTGDPDAVECRVGDRPVQPGRPTSFALNTLAMADLVRGRHARVLERLDAELERQVDPGVNLSADRYRFVRSMVLARSGFGDAVERAELAGELGRLYDASLRRGDDWNLGWAAWVAGQADARSGRSRAARRRLDTAVTAFGRAHRTGFADWPRATLVAVASLHEGAEPDSGDLDALRSPVHAVAAERSDALLALALHARAAGRRRNDVVAGLREAMAVAHRQREVLTGHLVAIEQLLLGVAPDAPPDDPAADGAVLVACRRALSGTVDDVETAAGDLIELGWSVVGVRLLAHAADRVRVADPRRATRILQLVRSTADGFDEPLRPWVLSTPPLPTLSERELEIARAVAGGAGRDELASRLVVSRRTIDSHLQRVYAKLGISSRAELRAWLEQTPEHRPRQRRS
jgi:DNA-binding CsgD family transcriptional regulator